MTSIAERGPVIMGLNVTAMLALAFAVSAIGVAVLTAKSPGFSPVRVRLVIVTLESELVARIWMGELVVPSSCPPKSKLVGVVVMESWLVTPFPDSGTRCGLPAALSVMLSVAEFGPFAAGLKPTAMVAVPFGAIVIGTVVTVVNADAFVPVNARPEMTRLEVPGFETVTWYTNELPTLA